MRYLLVFLLFSQNLWAQYDDPNVMKNNITFDVTSVITGNLTFGYERAVPGKISIATKVGAVGVGTKFYPDETPRGFFVQAGGRFWLNQNFGTDSRGRASLFHGTFFSPLLSYSILNFDRALDPQPAGATSTVRERKGIQSLAFTLGVGVQKMIHERISISFQAGVGYHLTTNDDSKENVRYYYGHLTGSPDVPVALTSSFTIGYCFR
jgi:hypothetical protein